MVQLGGNRGAAAPWPTATIADQRCSTPCDEGRSARHPFTSALPEPSA